MDHDWGAIKYARADGLDQGIVVVRVTSGIRLCLIAISNPKWLVQKLRGRRIKGTAEEARSVVSKVQVFASTTQVLARKLQFPGAYSEVDPPSVSRNHRIFERGGISENSGEASQNPIAASE